MYEIWLGGYEIVGYMKIGALIAPIFMWDIHFRMLFFEGYGFGVVDAAVEAVGCVVVGYESYDFYIFKDDWEFAYFFRYLATEGHFVFVVRCEYEWFAPSACEDGAEGVVVGVVVAAFELEGFDVRLCEPYVYARIREGLDCFATDGNCELAVCFVICMCDVHVERCD